MNSIENWNMPVIRNNNKQGMKPGKIYKGNSKKKWHNN